MENFFKPSFDAAYMAANNSIERTERTKEQENYLQLLLKLKNLISEGKSDDAKKIIDEELKELDYNPEKNK